jgi:hypothetical protein
MCVGGSRRSRKGLDHAPLDVPNSKAEEDLRLEETLAAFKSPFPCTQGDAKRAPLISLFIQSEQAMTETLDKFP